MNEEQRLRLFTALELPEGWRRTLAHVRGELERVSANEFKWVRPELMHLTLVFLGYQPASSLSDIEAALRWAASEVPPFSLALGQTGFFGQPHRLEVAWVGLASPPAELRQLHQAIGSHLSAHEVEFDPKPLVPHITLGRGRRPIDRGVSLRIHSVLQRLNLSTQPPLEVQDFVLMESHLSRFGPDYHVVRRFPLVGARS